MEFERIQGIFGDIDKSTAEAVDALQTVNKLGQDLDKNSAATAARLEDIEFNTKLENIEKAGNAELKKNKEVNDRALRDFDDRLDRQIAASKKADREAEKRQRKRARLAENLALGAGFPLLFGGGAGSIAGGVAGSFLGDGFGGQILLSGLGQVFDNLVAQGLELAKALDKPIENINKLLDALTPTRRSNQSSRCKSPCSRV